jgi:hypothetical protein
MDEYFGWAKAAGGTWLTFVIVIATFVIVIAYGAVECIQVASKWWLTYWSKHGSLGSQIHILMIYAIINLSSVVAIFFRLIFLMFLGLRASRILSQRLIGWWRNARC